MTQYLRQSTATVVPVGPFVDKTDGLTLEEAITVTNLTVSLFKHLDTLPADIITNGAMTTDTGWTKGTNWRVDNANSNLADQSTPTASDLEQTPSTALVENQAYEVTFTIASRTVGAIVVKVGGTSGTSRSSNATSFRMTPDSFNFWMRRQHGVVDRCTFAAISDFEIVASP